MRWEAFFGQDNVVGMQWSQLSNPNNPTRNELQPFLDLVEQRAPIAALPRVRQHPSRIDWYIGWRNESDARFAADLLTAFLGRTYARLDAPIIKLEPSDAAEKAFSEEFEGRAFRVEVSSSDRELRKQARDQLSRLAKCLRNRRVREVAKVRPVGRILRDFEFALQSGDDASAFAEIRTLRAGGHLDGANLAFLDLRRLATRNDWTAILAHEALPSVLDLRSLPWRVRTALLEAVYHHDLANLVETGAVDEALKRFSHRLQPFNVALSSRKNVNGLEADVCFLLADELRQTADTDSTNSTLARIQAAGQVAFAEAFRHRLGDHSGAVPPQTAALTTSANDRAKTALLNDDYDLAFVYALDSPPSQERVKLLLRCARLLDDEGAAIEAINAWDALPSSDQDELHDHTWSRTHYDRLKTELGHGSASPLATPVAAGSSTPAPSSSWLAWFERLLDAAQWPGAVSRASSGVAEWSVANIITDGGALTTIVAIVEGKLADWAGEALRQALPYILDAFLDDPPDTRLSPLFSSLFDLLATDDALTLPSISALIRLGHARLSTSPSLYRSTLDSLADAIEQADTPRSVRLISDALEMLIATPCASKTERTAAATRLVTLAVRWWQRVDRVDGALIRQLATELGLSELLPRDVETPAADRESDTEWSTLSGLQIAFYSLNESALARATAALAQACPDAKLKTFHEYASTEPMKEAARTADLFVIAAKSAKHSATDAITHNRPASKATEFAAGKGSTSLLDAVRRWLSNRSEN